MEGFIKLSRKTFEHSLWKEAREYSRFEAWLDLIQLAKIENGNAMYNGNLIEIRRGEVFVSLRYLAERWKWNKNKIDRYLKNLDENNMISLRRDRGATVVTLTNFELYNSRGTSAGNERDRGGTEAGQYIRIKELKNLIIKNKKIYKKIPLSDFFDEQILSIQFSTETDFVKNEIIDFLKKGKDKCVKNDEIPDINAFTAFGKEKSPDVSIEALNLKYQSWVENGWKTGKGNQIKNWKSTLLNTLPYLAKNQNSTNGNTKINGGAKIIVGGVDMSQADSFFGPGATELLEQSGIGRKG